jgi:hypothetical protein
VRDIELFEHGLELFNANRKEEFQEFMRQLKEENPLVASLLEVHQTLLRHNPAEVLRRGKRLFSAVSGKPEMAVRFYMRLGVAQKMIGEMNLSDGYFIRAMELAEELGDKPVIAQARVELSYNRFMRQEYDSLYRDLAGLGPGDPLFDHRHIRFIMAMIQTVQGETGKAKRILDSLAESDGVGEFMRVGLLEIRGILSRLEGRLGEAVDFYGRSAEGYLTLGSAYAVFPCAKALQVSRFTSLEPLPDKLTKNCLRMARKGSWGEQAAGKEIEALLIRDNGEAALQLFEATKGYYRAYQNMEAIMAGLSSAYLAWTASHPVFVETMRFLGPLLSLYPGFRKDPIIGGFMTKAEAFLEGERQDSRKGIKAWLIGDLRVEVDGSELPLARWGSKQAVRAFVYLLLSPRHRIPQDHLFYLLWPRKRYNHETRSRLYRIMSILRNNLGGSFLAKKRDFYQIEEVWTDLEELENLIRLADASQDPEQKETFLSRTRELSKGELLPEFQYDSYVDEYRQYYERLRKRIGGNSYPVKIP